MKLSFHTKHCEQKKKSKSSFFWKREVFFAHSILTASVLYPQTKSPSWTADGKWTVLVLHFSTPFDHSKSFYTTSHIQPFTKHKFFPHSVSFHKVLFLPHTPLNTYLLKVWALVFCLQAGERCQESNHRPSDCWISWFTGASGEKQILRWFWQTKRLGGDSFTRRSYVTNSTLHL